MLKMMFMLAITAVALTHAQEITTEDTNGLFQDARGTVEHLLQIGKSSSACRDLADAAKKEVKDNIASQQNTLDAMPKGGACKSEGQTEIAQAKKRLAAATAEDKAAIEEIEAAKKKKIDFGTFEFAQLKKGDCDTFFSSKIFADAEKQMNKALGRKKKADGVKSASTQAVKDAEKNVPRLVAECKCKAKKSLINARKSMNSGAKAANIKAWTKAHHMACVLDGVTMAKCTIPSLPQVQMVKLPKDMKTVCYQKTRFPTYYSCGSRYCTGGPKTYPSGRKFELILMDAVSRNDWNVNDPTMQHRWYEGVCKSAGEGFMPVGCGYVPYNDLTNNEMNCEKNLGPGKCLGTPASWQCSNQAQIQQHTKWVNRNQRQDFFTYFGGLYNAHSFFFTIADGWPQSGISGQTKINPAYNPICGRYL